MAITIEKFDLTRLHQEEDLGFHEMVYPRLATITDPALLPIILRYRTAIDAFDAALKQDRASILTEEIKNLDYQIGNTYHGLRDIVNRMLRYTQEAKAAAARKIDIVMRKYDAKTDPTTLALVEQIEVFQNMIDDIKSSDAMAALSTIGSKGWFEDLDSFNKLMAKLYTQRTDDTSSFVSGLSKQCRKAVDDDYLVCTGYINSIIAVTGAEQYKTVVEEINRLIDEMKVTLASRKTTNETRRKHNLSQADVSDIPVQVYTGQPIYPFFEVFIDGAKLVNGTEYAPEYKKNTDVGTASILISGRNKYTGKKTVTFNIARTL
jgi:hypothetical protein